MSKLPVYITAALFGMLGLVGAVIFAFPEHVKEINDYRESLIQEVAGDYMPEPTRIRRR